MHKNKVVSALAVAALCAGFSLSAATPGDAAPRDTAAIVTPAEQPSLTADKVLVHPGNTLVMKLQHGQEAVSWISSPAFSRQRANQRTPSRESPRSCTTRRAKPMPSRPSTPFHRGPTRSPPESAAE